MPQSLLVTVYVIFGMTCTIGLSFTLPVVANVLLAVFSSVFGEIAGSKVKGFKSGTLAPDEGGDFEQVVIGYPPGFVPPVRHHGAMEVEPDTVPTGMLARLGLAVTVVIVGLVILAVQLFNAQLSQELTAKGYADGVTTVPRASAQ
jgi:hypothetical protein